MAVLLMAVTREPEGRDFSPGREQKGAGATREGSRAWCELNALHGAANPMQVQPGLLSAKPRKSGNRPLHTKQGQ